MTGEASRRLRLVRGLGTAAMLAAMVAPGVALAQKAGSGAPLSAADAELFERGVQAMQASRPVEAITAFQKVSGDAPRFAEGFLNLGLAYTQVGRDQDAKIALEKSVTLKPSLRGAHLFLAIAEYKLGEYTAATVAIRKETTLSAKDPRAWMWQGIIDLAAGQLAAAVEDLDHANGLDPSNVDILYQRGHAALVLSRQSYEAMFKADPHSWHVAQVLAEADVEQGNDADAIEQFKAAIATAPPQSGLYEGLGSAYWRTGKYPEAQQAYEEAVKIDPADIVSVYKLGCLHVDRGDAAGGKPLLEKALATDSSLSLASYYLGRAEIQLGNDQAAIAHFEQTIHENLDDDTTKQAYFQLSRVYRRMHNQAASDEAQAQYRILEDKGRQVLQEKLNRRLMRGDRDVTIPSPPADKSSTQPSPTQPQKQE